MTTPPTDEQLAEWANRLDQRGTLRWKEQFALHQEVRRLRDDLCSYCEGVAVFGSTALKGGVGGQTITACPACDGTGKGTVERELKFQYYAQRERADKAEARVKQLETEVAAWQRGFGGEQLRELLEKAEAELESYKGTVKDLMSDLYQGPWSKRTGPDSQGNMHLVFVHDLASFDALRALNQKDS